MPIPYEILIRGEKGAFKGAHVINEPGGVARAIRAEDWPEIASAVNASALTEIDRLNAELAEKALLLAKLQASVDRGIAAIRDAILDPAVHTETAVLKIINEETKDERAKACDALDAQIAELTAKRNALA